MKQWDLFLRGLETSPSQKFISGLIFTPQSGSSHLFEEISRLLLSLVMDISTLSYDPRCLVASLMCTVMGKALNFWQTGSEIQQTCQASNNFLQSMGSFGSVFQSFLARNMAGIDLVHLTRTTCFVAEFVGMPVQYVREEEALTAREQVILHSHNLALMPVFQ